MDVDAAIGWGVGGVVVGAVRLIFNGLFNTLFGSTPVASFWRILKILSALGFEQLVPSPPAGVLGARLGGMCCTVLQVWPAAMAVSRWGVCPT